jgi:regulator of nonsense transcripts 1
MEKLREQLREKMALENEGTSVPLPPATISFDPPVAPDSQPVVETPPGNDDDNDDEDASSVASSSSGESSMSSSTSISEESLPDYHCRYCLISNPESVAMCVETKKWFCSSVTQSTSGASHLINHLVKSRSHTVQLHCEGPLGDTILECYNCAARNIFTLGSVPASATSPIVVILCRACVENVRELKDMEWQTHKWEGLIQSRKLVDWITTSSERDEVAAREMNSSQIAKLEDLWKKQPDATLEDLDRPDIMEEAQVEPIGLAWDDGYHYQNVMAPLIQMEADYDKSIKEALSEERVSLRWDKSLNGRHVVCFSFGRDASESRLMIGDELNLKLSKGGEFLNGGKPWEAKGWAKYIDDGEVELELR